MVAQAGGWTEEENTVLIAAMGNMRAPWTKDTWSAKLRSQLSRQTATSTRSHWYEHLRIGPSQAVQYLSEKVSSIVTQPCPVCIKGSGKAKGHSGTHRTTLSAGSRKKKRPASSPL